MPTTRSLRYGHKSALQSGDTFMRHKHVALMTGAAATLLMLAGCGGNDASPASPAGASDTASVASDPSASSSPTASPTPMQVDARPYFAALGTGDVGIMLRAEKRTAPGSLAHAYIQEQVDGNNAELDEGTSDPGQALTKKGNGFRLCSGKGSKRSCYTYDHFKVDGQGRLANFAINGRPLNGRLVLGNGRSVDSTIATVKLLSAYETAGGDLAVNVTVRAKGTGVTFFDPSATYRAPSGQQRALASQDGLSDLSPRSLSHELFIFAGPLKLGGSIILQLGSHSGGDNYGGSVYVPVKVG